MGARSSRQLPSNRRHSEIIAQQACNGRPLYRSRTPQDEAMNARATLITWMLAMLPALAGLVKTGAFA